MILNENIHTYLNSLAPLLLHVNLVSGLEELYLTQQFFTIWIKKMFETLLRDIDIF